MTMIRSLLLAAAVSAFAGAGWFQEEGYQRAPTQFDERYALIQLATALGAALIVQSIAGLVWAGGAAARIGTLEARVGDSRFAGRFVSPTRPGEPWDPLDAQGQPMRPIPTPVTAPMRAGPECAHWSAVPPRDWPTVWSLI